MITLDGGDSVVFHVAMSRCKDSLHLNPADLLGQLVRCYRDRKSLTQAQLGELANVPRQNISAVEQGRRGLAPETLHRLGAALGLSDDERSELVDAAKARLTARFGEVG